MEHTKKMALVPHNMLQQIQAKQLQLDNNNPSFNRLVDMDSEMRSIIASGASDDAKFKMYQQTLQRYLFLKEEQRKPLELQIVAQAETPTTVKPEVVKVRSRLDLSTLIPGLPKTNRPAAKLLIGHIASTEALDWNENGEVIVNGERVLNSNITDLISAVSRQRKNPQIVGLDVFVRALKTSNVPQSAVVNRSLFQQKADELVPNQQLLTQGPSTSKPLSLSKKRPRQRVSDAQSMDEGREK